MARTAPRSTRNSERRLPFQRRLASIVLLVAAVLIVLGFGGWYAFGRMIERTEPTHTHAEDSSEVGHTHGQAGAELPHVHGLGYSADGRQLWVPTHTGFRIFADGAWSTPELPAHDYMGYAAADDGFYSSGHPAPNSDLVNPLGLVKSTDGGKTLTKLGFEGESDFHVMGVGYRNHAIYVLNQAPNSQLATGMYYSLDDGATWQRSALQGVAVPPIQIAVHPTDASIVALATEAGLLLSSDHGDSFDIVTDEPVSAVAFDPSGERLFFGYRRLSIYHIQQQQVDALQTPASASDDALGYIAVNPARPDELAIATFGRTIYLSPDRGQSWQPIAEQGVGIASE